MPQNYVRPGRAACRVFFMCASEQNKVSPRRSLPACIRALFQWRKTTPRGPIFTKQSQRAKTLIEQHVMCEGGFTHMNPASKVGSSALRETQPSGTATTASVAAALIYKSTGPVFTKQTQQTKRVIPEAVICEASAHSRIARRRSRLRLPSHPPNTRSKPCDFRRSNGSGLAWNLRLIACYPSVVALIRPCSRPC
jgi:hypothetical protein